MRRILMSLAVLFLSAAPALAAAREVADSDISRVIDEIKRYLYAQEKADGTWPSPQMPNVPGAGPGALALFALLEADEEIDNPQIKLALNALASQNLNGCGQRTYVTALRTMIFSQVVPRQKDSNYKELLKKEIDWLKKGDRGEKTLLNEGAWHYQGPDSGGDNSCSQMGLLALWEADAAGQEIEAKLFQKIENTWVTRQQADGGWGYAPENKATTVSMTAAGLASMFICRDILNAPAASYQQKQKCIDAAWGYLGKTLDPNFVSYQYTRGYLPFCVQRVGMTTGRKFIGKMDWFAEGAAVLCEPKPGGRGYGGQWGSIVEAGFELIFLARGQLPLAYNKLQFGEEKHWNFHNRDLAHLTQDIRREFENLRLRWQVVDIADNVQLMLDAPVLLVSSDVALSFGPEQWDRLREYSLRGGTLLFVASGDKPKEFLESTKKALGDLYAKQREMNGGKFFELAKLPADHPVYSGYKRVENGNTKIPMWGISDGTRLLAVLCEKDIALSWQKKDHINGNDDYLMGVNFYRYATGANKMGSKMRPVFAGTSTVAKQEVKVAWLKHGGNWCTQPYALDYLSQKLTAENKLSLNVRAGVPIELDALQAANIAWMTGTAGFTLNDREMVDLRRWLDDGGVLFINAVGGSKEFNASAQAMLDTLYGSHSVSVGSPPVSSGLITGKCGDYRGPSLLDSNQGGDNLLPLARTEVWKKKAPTDKGLILRVYEKKDRPQVVYCPYGIHDTLDGHTAYDAMSYLTMPALDIAENIALYAFVNSTSGQGPTTTPSTAPAASATAPAAASPPPAAMPSSAPASAPAGAK